MAAIDSWNLSQDTDFQRRLSVLYVRAAVALSGGSSSGNPTRDALVSDLCVRILSAPQSFISQFAFAVVQNPAITALSTDDDIYSVVAAVFPYVAGWNTLMQ